LACTVKSPSLFKGSRDESSMPKVQSRLKCKRKKLPAKGAYVRCRKCQHKFFIKKEEPAETTAKTIECPRCKLPQRGINECEYCGLVFEENSKTKKNSRSKNLKKDSFTTANSVKPKYPETLNPAPIVESFK
jgi:DNA-directed RNA polymerase subunit RPC12/RpoP